MRSSTILAAFTTARLRTVKVLLVISFVFPFFNINHFYPQATFEVNFLPVLLAVVVMPEIIMADGLSLLLLGTTLEVSGLWGSSEAMLRMIIGVVPCLFLLNLQEYCLQRGEELIPRRIAYRTLQVFVAFSVVQWFSLDLYPIIPAWFSDLMSAIIPRYSGELYDQLGVRGVQGWASEPSAAAMACFAFAIVAAQQEPEKRTRILGLLSILLVVNKSVYGLLLLTLLGIIHIFSLKRKWLAAGGMAVLVAVFAYYVSQSSRIEEFTTSVAVYGLQLESNFQLFRINQIIYPLAAFPRIYKPAYIFGDTLEPMGLLPLLVGYGSICGLLLYVRLVFFKFPLRAATSVPLAVTTLFVLSFLTPPDLIPAIVAVAYALAPTSGTAARIPWYHWVASKAQQAYAAPTAQPSG